MLFIPGGRLADTFLVIISSEENPLLLWLGHGIIKQRMPLQSCLPCQQPFTGRVVAGALPAYARRFQCILGLDPVRIEPINLATNIFQRHLRGIQQVGIYVI